MTGFNDAKFANNLMRICTATNPGQRQNCWQVDGVTWCRDRHSYHGQDYAFQCEAHTLTCVGRNGWTLLYINETWWDEAEKNAIRSNRWGRLLKGKKADALAWMKKQEVRL